MEQTKKFERLKNYFRALKNNTLDVYHTKRGR